MYRMLLVVGLMVGVLPAQEQTPDHRLRTATTVLHEILSAPDKGIPADLLANAQCVMIVPGLKKGAFIVGGEYGRGFAFCRRGGVWGGPAAIKFGGGSFGAQIGGESSAAAGPVGRTGAADTDILLHAEILSYSRTRGVFAGVSLDGTVVSHDGSEDRKLYGHEVSNQAVLTGEVPSPVAARALIAELDRYSPAKH